MADGYPRVARAHAPPPLAPAPTSHRDAVAVGRGADLVAVHVAHDAVAPQRGRGLAAGRCAPASEAGRGAPAAGSGRRTAVPPGLPNPDPRYRAVAGAGDRRDYIRPRPRRADGVREL